jgi:hypothetical protein
MDILHTSDHKICFFQTRNSGGSSALRASVGTHLEHIANVSRWHFPPAYYIVASLHTTDHPNYSHCRNDAQMRSFEATQLAVACEEKNKELTLLKLKIENLQDKLVSCFITHVFICLPTTRTKYYCLSTGSSATEHVFVGNSTTMQRYISAFRTTVLADGT